MKAVAVAGNAWRRFQVQGLEAIWYRGHWLGQLLRPLSWVYCALAGLRRNAYLQGWLGVRQLPVPVIVVGNINVGGSGKTPFLIWLATALQARGRRPGILSRGYGGKSQHQPLGVTSDSDPLLVGDEPVLLARRTGCPVAVGADRVRAAEYLLGTSDCDLLLSDDGLQHYRLGRAVEIAVIDGERRLGNGRCLPSGPLRERPRRLTEVDLVVVKGRAIRSGEYAMSFHGERVRKLARPELERPLTAFRDARVLAVAGIGHPASFFRALRQAGLEIEERPFPDHHVFTPMDLGLSGEAAIIMTEKDAVKCEDFASENLWYVPIEARVDVDILPRIDALLKRWEGGQKTA